MTSVDTTSHRWSAYALCTPNIADHFHDAGIGIARRLVHGYCRACPVKTECLADRLAAPALSRRSTVAGGWWWDGSGKAHNLLEDPRTRGTAS